MVDNNKDTLVESIAKSAEKISDSKRLVAIGQGLGWGIMALAFALMIIAIGASSKWDGRLFSRTSMF